MKRIELPVHGIFVEVDTVNTGGGNVLCSADLYETCPKCGKKECCYSCDESAGRDGTPEVQVAARHQYNGAIDGISSLILAHAIAGIDIESPAYLEGIETAFDAVGNNT